VATSMLLFSLQIYLKKSAVIIVISKFNSSHGLEYDCYNVLRYVGV
jgi:hypothetical protein